MWDTAEHGPAFQHGAAYEYGAASEYGNVVHLSHDLPCPRCGHAMHRFLPCSDTCGCVPPPVPGMALDPREYVDTDLVLLAIA